MTNAVRNRVVKRAGVDNDTSKPIIINGDMAIAQRGTSFTSQTGVAYHLDRYEVSGYNMGDGVYRVDQSTDVPSGQGFINSNKISCTTADSSQDANNQFYFQTQLEGTATSFLKYFVSSPDTITLAFWVRSNRTGTHSLALKLSHNGSVENNTSTRIYHKLYTISSADTWEKQTCVITLDSASKTKVTGTGFAVAVQFWLGAGTDRDGASANSWLDNGNATTASDNEDMLASTDNDWFITGLQIEVGDFNNDTIPEFQFESHIDNLRRCQRYFHIGVGLDGNTTGFANGSFRTNATAQILHQFPVGMRTEPTATQIATDNIIAHDTADGNNINVDSIQSILFNCENNIVVQYTLEGTSAAAGDGCYIYPTGSTPGIKFEGEL